MYQSHKLYVKPDTKVLEMIEENHSLLLFLEHLEIDFSVGDKSVMVLCREYNVDLNLFLIIANMYNGFYPDREDVQRIRDISGVIRLLKNSHLFFKEDKYVEIKNSLETLKRLYDTEDIPLIEKFFDDYFNEVVEHLDYEDNIAFPYFLALLDSGSKLSESMFKVSVYKDNHSDIETKLTDLKNLLLKYIKLQGNLSVRRKFLISLYELESDLVIHSLIEELILLPLIARVEKERSNG
ncbi:MAG: hemerythrin domain-containing protein [Rikenellaceae bacterium]|nr:hemerythrin domain-containing protein [Rikenellaceae bacterium]